MIEIETEIGGVLVEAISTLKHLKVYLKEFEGIIRV